MYTREIELEFITVEMVPWLFNIYPFHLRGKLTHQRNSLRLTDDNWILRRIEWNSLAKGLLSTIPYGQLQIRSVVVCRVFLWRGSCKFSLIYGNACHMLWAVGDGISVIWVICVSCRVFYGPCIISSVMCCDTGEIHFIQNSMCFVLRWIFGFLHGMRRLCSI